LRGFIVKKNVKSKKVGFYSTAIAVVGHSSAARFAESTAPPGTELPITTALSATILKTSGHVETHKLHPIHASLSTFAFNFYLLSHL